MGCDQRIFDVYDQIGSGIIPAACWFAFIKDRTKNLYLCNNTYYGCISGVDRLGKYSDDVCTGLWYCSKFQYVI